MVTVLTVENGDESLCDRATDAPTPATTIARDDRGRFGPGNRFSRGRPKSSITDALRRQVDPERVAAMLIAILEDPHAPVRERVRCAELIADRLEGKAVSRSVTIRAASAILPVGFDEMALDAKCAVLDEIRSRAIGGELPPGEPE